MMCIGTRMTKGAAFALAAALAASAALAQTAPPGAEAAQAQAQAQGPAAAGAQQDVQGQNPPATAVPLPAPGVAVPLPPNVYQPPAYPLPQGVQLPQGGPPQAGQAARAPQAVAAPSPEEAAFWAALQSLAPMSPAQIRQYRQHIDESQRAFSAPVGPAPKPVSRAVAVSLKPGEASPVVRMAVGNVATVTFSDVTGQPWAVQSVTTGNPTQFAAQAAGVDPRQEKDGKTNIVVISPLAPHAQSNMVITLIGNPVPITLTLKSGQSEIDYRLDVKIERRGPNAAPDYVGSTALAPVNDSVVQRFLDGVPPDGAKPLKSTSGAVEAWSFENAVYVRTPLELLSPAYLRKAANVSGTKVYTVPDAPVLILSDDGRMTTVSVER